MKVTGYALREQLRQLDLKLKTLHNQFEESLSKFEGEEKQTPASFDEQILNTEKAITRLQEAQARYNLAVTAEVAGEKYTLTALVKLIGGAGRREKMWRSVAAPKKDRYSYKTTDERDPGKLYAKPQVTIEQATVFAAKASKFAGLVRAAINVANSNSIDLELDPKLFD